MAAIDYFLRIDGVEGESTDSKHKGWIDVESWSWGETQAASHGGAGGSGAGKVTFQDLHFVAKVSKASPKLFLACASGQHLKEAQLVARKAGKEQQEFLTWTFSDLLVSGYQTGGTEAESALPIDSVSLNFAKAQVSYKAQRPDGSLDAAVTAGWDVKTNKKV
jgi:type VI secretion system secreted protein Hcp